jgi:hypothetical protein
MGAAQSASSTHPTPTADRACQQPCHTLSHRQRPDPPVERGRPRSGHGTLLCPAQLPGTADSVAADGLIGINSIANTTGELSHRRRSRRR